MNDKKVIIDLGAQGKVLLKSQLFNSAEEVDLDAMLRIDMSNFHLELLTIPVILNHVGLLLADAIERSTRKKLEIEIYEAQQADAFRTAEVESGRKPPSNERTHEYVLMQPGYRAHKMVHLKYLKE